MDDWEKEWIFTLQRHTFEELYLELINSFDLMFTKNPRQRFEQVTGHFQHEIFKEIRNDLIAGQNFPPQKPIFKGKSSDTRVIWNHRKYDYFMFSANRALNLPGMDKMTEIELRKNGCQVFSMTPYEQLFRRIQVQRAQHFIDRLEDKSRIISEMYGGTKPSEERKNKIYTYQSTLDNQIKREKQIFHLINQSSIDYTGEKTIPDPMGQLHRNQYLELKAKQAAYIIRKSAVDLLRQNDPVTRSKLFQVYNEQWLIYKRGADHIRQVSTELDREYRPGLIL